MKKSIITLILALHILHVDSQLVFQENFTKYFNPAANGWVVKNLSQSPVNNHAWEQGSSMFFPAYNGGAEDFFASSFMATNANTPVTLSAWLLTPTLTLINGSVFEFYSRTVSNPATYPDRLEVYLSTAGTSTNVGTSYTSTGTFSTLLVTINPSLTTTDYPEIWTLYTATISGLSAPETGRFGFRYHVTNGGSSQQAVNSEFIGIDAVKYTLPCKAVVSSYTTCAGQSLTLAALGAAAGTSFTWNPGTPGSSSLVITPSATAVYTLNYDVADLKCPALTSTVTISTQLNINLSASSASFCEGGTAVLTATGAASSYTWLNNNSNDAEIIVAPNVTTIYTVTGSSGSFPNNFCAGASTILVTVHPNPVLVASLSRSLACVNETVLVSVSGADSYTWTGVFSATVSSFVFKTGSSVGGKTFFVEGATVHGCTDTAAMMVKVDKCTGIEEAGFSGKDLNAYPQPFGNRLTVSGEKGTLSLFNMLGGKVREYETDGEIVIDTSSLPAGSYFLVLYSSETGKIKTLNAVKIEGN